MIGVFLRIGDQSFFVKRFLENAVFLFLKSVFFSNKGSSAKFSVPDKSGACQIFLHRFQICFLEIYHALKFFWSFGEKCRKNASFLVKIYYFGKYGQV